MDPEGPILAAPPLTRKVRGCAGIVSDGARQAGCPGSDTSAELTSIRRTFGRSVGGGIMILSLMSVRRSVIRSWRRLRRPTLGRLLWASVALHVVVGLGILAWLARESSQAPPPTPAPLIVELPPAEPGPPLVRPETPPARSATRPTPPAARPAPAPRPPAPPPPSVAKLPEPPPPTPAPPAPVTPPPAAPAPPTPPVVARAPEPSPPAPPEPASPTPATPPSPSPAPPAASVEPPSPAVAARPSPPGARAGCPPLPGPRSRPSPRFSAGSSRSSGLALTCRHPSRRRRRPGVEGRARRDRGPGALDTSETARPACR